MDTNMAIAALAALAHRTRLDAFRLLVSREPTGLPAGEIAIAIDVPQNTMSVHLAALARAGLVAGERSGRQIIYRADVERLGHLARFLVDDCCGGRPEACGAFFAGCGSRCP